MHGPTHRLTSSPSAEPSSPSTPASTIPNLAFNPATPPPPSRWPPPDSPSIRAASGKPPAAPAPPHLNGPPSLPSPTRAVPSPTKAPSTAQPNPYPPSPLSPTTTSTPSPTPPPPPAAAPPSPTASSPISSQSKLLAPDIVNPILSPPFHSPFSIFHSRPPARVDLRSRLATLSVAPPPHDVYRLIPFCASPPCRDSLYGHSPQGQPAALEACQQTITAGILIPAVSATCVNRGDKI